VGQCSQAACDESGTCWPAFILPFRSGRRPERIVVPLEVCATHGALIGAALASPERRRVLAQACGTAASDIDWERCRCELVPCALSTSRAVSRQALG
jgi:hypothetical protein